MAGRSQTHTCWRWEEGSLECCDRLGTGYTTEHRGPVFLGSTKHRCLMYNITPSHRGSAVRAVSTWRLLRQAVRIIFSDGNKTCKMFQKSYYPPPLVPKHAY